MIDKIVNIGVFALRGTNYNNKFVASDVSCQVLSGCTFVDDLRQFQNGIVTLGVAIYIVDIAQMIQVNANHMHRLALSHTFGLGIFQFNGKTMGI